MDEAAKRQVKAWFAKAEEDLYTAKRLVSDEYFPVGIVCFHCQQCAEKYLKGLLVAKGINVAKSHDLVYLLELVQDRQLFDEIFDHVEVLTDYSVEPRYPSEDADIPPFEAHEAVKSAEAVKLAVLKRVDLS